MKIEFGRYGGQEIKKVGINLVTATPYPTLSSLWSCLHRQRHVSNFIIAMGILFEFSWFNAQNTMQIDLFCLQWLYSCVTRIHKILFVWQTKMSEKWHNQTCSQANPVENPHETVSIRSDAHGTFKFVSRCLWWTDSGSTRPLSQQDHVLKA